LKNNTPHTLFRKVVKSLESSIKSPTLMKKQKVHAPVYVAWVW